MAVLSMVEKRKRYGYELLRGLEEARRHVLKIKEGTLHPLLHRLEDAGYIPGEWQAADRARPRKYCRITPGGRARGKLLKEGGPVSRRRSRIS